MSNLAIWQETKEKAQIAIKTGFYAGLKSVEQAVMVAIAGQDLGIPLTAALNGIHVIQGKPTLSAQAMHGLVLQRLPGALFAVRVSSDTECVVVAALDKADPHALTVRYTMEDAQKAGLTSKDMWKKYPRAMLRSRAISEAARSVFPHIIMGFYTDEEIEHIDHRSEPQRVELRSAVVDALPIEVPQLAVPQFTLEDFKEKLSSFETVATIEELDMVRGIVKDDFKRLPTMSATERQTLVQVVAARVQTARDRINAAMQAAQAAQAPESSREPGEDLEEAAQ